MLWGHVMCIHGLCVLRMNFVVTAYTCTQVHVHCVNVPMYIKQCAINLCVCLPCVCSVLDVVSLLLPLQVTELSLMHAEYLYALTRVRLKLATTIAPPRKGHGPCMYMCTCKHTHVRALIHVRTHVSMQMYMYMYIHMYLHVHVCKCTCTCTYTCTCRLKYSEQGKCDCIRGCTYMYV